MRYIVCRACRVVFLAHTYLIHVSPWHHDVLLWILMGSCGGDLTRILPFHDLQPVCTTESLIALETF